MEQMLTEFAKPGDLIEVFRGLYKHWAVYIGDGEVVHLVNSNDDVGSFNSVVKSIDNNKGVVKRQKLCDMTYGDDYRINNFLDNEYEPRDWHIIVKDAILLEGVELPYSVITKNCEHFATDLHYGKARSRQVENTAMTSGGILAFLSAVVTGLFAIFRS